MEPQLRLLGRGGSRVVLALAFSTALGTLSCNSPEDVRDILEELHHGGGSGGGGGGGARRCGGPRDLPCDKGQFCEISDGTCGGVGVCRSRPEVCTQQSAPVCGCDRQTYGNDCFRAAAGVSKLSDGACVNEVVVGEGKECGGFTLPPIRVCEPGLFCMQRPGTCNIADLPGVCERTPGACTREFLPVCGCDGKTYANDCLRRNARVALDHKGECNTRPGGNEGEMCDGFAGLPCARGLFCEHEPGTCRIADGAGVCRPTPEVCADIFAPVCGCDGKTYGNDCVRQGAGVPKDHDGAC